MPGGDYRTALRTRAGWREQPAPWSMPTARTVGEHRGAAAYTVGQRQGLGVALGEPRYVSRSTPAPTSSRWAGARTSTGASSKSRRSRSSAARRRPDEFEAAVRIRHRARDRAGPRSATSKAAAGRSACRARHGRPRPARRPSSMLADEVIGGGRIAVEPGRPGAGPCRAGRPLPHRRVPGDPRLGRAAAAVRRGRRDTGRLRRPGAGDAPGRSAPDRRLRAGLGVALAWLGIALIVAASLLSAPR